MIRNNFSIYLNRDRVRRKAKRNLIGRGGVKVVSHFLQALTVPQIPILPLLRLPRGDSTGAILPAGGLSVVETITQSLMEDKDLEFLNMLIVCLGVFHLYGDPETHRISL